MAYRECENCHRKMEPYRSRARNENGLLVCEGCANGREGRPLTGMKIAKKAAPGTIAKAPFARLAGIGLVKLAHDSGDGETIYHCGAADEKFWTYDGLKTLGECVDTTQMVLTNTGSGAVWREAIIHSYGEQELWKVTLRRNKEIKKTFWTADHRWLVRTRTESKIVVTSDLVADQRLAWTLPKSYLANSTPSQFGIAHGITYGDGTLTTNGSLVRLWGDKDAQLLKFFSESKQYPEKTPNGVLGMRVVGLPNAWKSLPDLSESTSYLYGWLAGYFAADGCVEENGTAEMSSASRENLEFFQLVAARLGIATYDIREQERQGYGDGPSTLYRLSLISSTIPSDFFLIAEHRLRHDAKVERGNPEPIGWTVVSVEKTDRVEEVYCARVPGSENFVLDGWINTMNCPFCGSGQVVARSDGTTECEFCHNCFIVQVQPTQPEMPQTINGQPYQIPGMPERSTQPSGDNAIQNPDGPVQGEAPDDGSDDGGSFGGDDLSDKVNLETKAALITEDGYVLGEDSYMARLALLHSDDPVETLQEIRRANRGH